MPRRGQLTWRSFGCCGGCEIAVVDVRGDDMPVVLYELKDTFRQLHAAGLPPTEPTGDELLSRIKAVNHVPRLILEQCTAALLQEYAAFLAQNEESRT
jgi:hypothetical protein